MKEKQFSKEFLVGLASAGHQVEGQNTNSDIWALEHMKYGGYPEKSGDATGFYYTYEQDFEKMQQAGLNACRFSLEWSRIEPEEGRFNQSEIEHYRKVISSCKSHGMEPFVTLFHFASPKWLISKGGWESQDTINYFSRYVEHVARELGNELNKVCTINEANLGVLISGYLDKMNASNSEDTSLQIGLDLKDWNKEQDEKEKEMWSVFGVKNAEVFPAPRSRNGNDIILRAHQEAVKILHNICPHLEVGLSLSLHDLQAVDGGNELKKSNGKKNF